MDQRRHPVRNFVAVLVLAALALGGLWWTGAVTPRLRTAEETTIASSCTGRVSVFVRLSNLAPFAVEVRDVRVIARGLDVDRTLVGGEPVDRPDGRGVRPPDGTPFKPFRLAPGKGRMITATGRLANEADIAEQLGSPDITVTARTPLGIIRTVPAGPDPKGFSSSSQSGPDCLPR